MTPPSGADFDLILYDFTDLTEFDKVDESKNRGKGLSKSVEGTATRAGDWYIRVYRYSGEGIYSMNVTVT